MAPIKEQEIIGDDTQAVILTLGGGDVVRAEVGAMMLSGLGDLIGGDR